MLSCGCNWNVLPQKLLPPIPFAKNKAIPGLLPLTAEMCGRPSPKLTLPSNNVKSLGGATKAESSARKEEVYSPTKQLLPGRRQPYAHLTQDSGLPPFLPPSPEALARTASRRGIASGCCRDPRLARRENRKVLCVYRENAAGRCYGKHSPLTR